MRLRKPASTVMIALCLQACGTVNTLVGRKGGWRYPYEAVVQDFAMMTDDIAGTELAYEGGNFMGMVVRPSFVGGFVSLPIDFVIDTIFAWFCVADGIVRLTWTGERYSH